MSVDFSLNKEKPRVRIRIFRAIDEPETCEKFIIGHKHILVNFGIEKITSAKNNWVDNPGVFVFIVESLDKTKVYGGIRVHIANESNPLPIEEAIGLMDIKIFDLVNYYKQNITAEGCGLWNSREIAGYGIGSIFLSRAAIAGASLLGVTSAFTLCAPYTVNMAQKMGYRIEERLGLKGTFYYPKLDLIATVLMHHNLKNLQTANPENQKIILSLINKPNITRIESLRNHQIEIHYQLNLKF